MVTNYFDTDVAAWYDAGSPEMFAPDVLGPTVDLLAELAGEQAALELAIGTGRVALPLSQCGVRVHGIELSPAMAARLRAKPGAGDVGVTVNGRTVSPGGSRRSAGTSTSMTKQPPGSRWAATLRKHATWSSCDVRFSIVLYTR